MLRKSSRSSHGFTLIELMVGLIVGLIVTLAAISFVVSIAKANSEGIQVTRLTQELRSLSEVMSREIRRARYAQDPIGYVNQAGNPDAPTPPAALTVTPSPAGSCVSLQYDVPDGVRQSRSIYLNTVQGSVYMANNLTCTNGTQISSDAVVVDNLTFTVASAFQVDQQVRARLRNGPPDLTNLPRQFNQTIFIRSGPVN